MASSPSDAVRDTAREEFQMQAQLTSVPGYQGFKGSHLKGRDLAAFYEILLSDKPQNTSPARHLVCGLGKILRLATSLRRERRDLCPDEHSRFWQIIAEQMDPDVSTFISANFMDYKAIVAFYSSGSLPSFEITIEPPIIKLPVEITEQMSDAITYNVAVACWLAAHKGSRYTMSISLSEHTISRKRPSGPAGTSDSQSRTPQNKYQPRCDHVLEEILSLQHLLKSQIQKLEQALPSGRHQEGINGIRVAVGASASRELASHNEIQRALQKHMDEIRRCRALAQALTNHSMHYVHASALHNNEALLQRDQRIMQLELDLVNARGLSLDSSTQLLRAKEMFAEAEDQFMKATEEGRSMLMKVLHNSDSVRNEDKKKISQLEIELIEQSAAHKKELEVRDLEIATLKEDQVTYERDRQAHKAELSTLKKKIQYVQAIMQSL